MKKEEGLDAAAAALDAAKLRLRPILMTSFAFILGVVPLVTAAGAGAESRKVMGLAVFSGLLIATALAIYIIPSLFVMVEKYFVRDKSKVPSPETGPQIPHSGEKGE
jgi:HAE1 family hydrophobic/amphiphilic exporter-1